MWATTEAPAPRRLLSLGREPNNSRVATVSAFLTVGRCFMQKPTVKNKAIDRGYRLKVASTPSGDYTGSGPTMPRFGCRGLRFSFGDQNSVISTKAEIQCRGGPCGRPRRAWKSLCENLPCTCCSGDLRSPNCLILKDGGQRPPLQSLVFT
jgi:hypothetical protein